MRGRSDLIVAAHFFLPGTGWDWWPLAHDEDGGVPQLFCLVRGQEIELGYVALAELEGVRSPLGLPVERDDDWEECSLAELHRRLSAPLPTRQPVGYWRRGWTGRRTGDNGGAKPVAGPLGPGADGMMASDDVLAVLDRLRRAGVRAYVGGGWGIDALLHRQTRPHRDLDLAIDSAREAAAVRALEAADFAIVPECDWRPARLLLRDARGREVDLHPVRFDAAGNGTQANLPGLPPFSYPADQLTSGQIGTRIVPCLGAALQRRFHEGYEPTRKDLDDLRLLRGLTGGGADDMAPGRHDAY